MLGVGWCVLGVACWVLGAGGWVLDLPDSVLGVVGCGSLNLILSCNGFTTELF